MAPFRLACSGLTRCPAWLVAGLSLLALECGTTQPPVPAPAGTVAPSAAPATSASPEDQAAAIAALKQARAARERGVLDVAADQSRLELVLAEHLGS